MGLKINCCYSNNPQTSPQDVPTLAPLKRKTPRGNRDISILMSTQTDRSEIDRDRIDSMLSTEKNSVKDDDAHNSDQEAQFGEKDEKHIQP